MRCWCGYLSGVWCKWFVYGLVPAHPGRAGEGAVKWLCVCVRTFEKAAEKRKFEQFLNLMFVSHLVTHHDQILHKRVNPSYTFPDRKVLCALYVDAVTPVP